MKIQQNLTARKMSFVLERDFSSLKMSKILKGDLLLSCSSVDRMKMRKIQRWGFFGWYSLDHMVKDCEKRTFQSGNCHLTKKLAIVRVGHFFARRR